MFHGDKAEVDVVHCSTNAGTACRHSADLPMPSAARRNDQRREYMMASLDLADLLAGANENLGIEFKAWMDTRKHDARAKLARHIAALANHGGGYLIFGVDDKTREPLGATDLDLTLFGQDAISSIVKKYLEPRIQVLVEHIEHEGVTYPVVVVPSHGARPVVAIADGPRDGRDRPIGVFTSGWQDQRMRRSATLTIGTHFSIAAFLIGAICWAKSCGSRLLGSPDLIRR